MRTAFIFYHVINGGILQAVRAVCFGEHIDPERGLPPNVFERFALRNFPVYNQRLNLSKISASSFSRMMTPSLASLRLLLKAALKYEDRLQRRPRWMPKVVASAPTLT